MNALSKLLLTVTLFSLALSACAPAVAQAGQNTPTIPAATLPAPSSTPVANTPAPTEVTSAPDGGGASVITLDYNNQLITMHPDETFLLKLGEGYTWDLAIDNMSVISRIPNIAVIRGAQGIYKAHMPGKATLTAQGDPECRQVKPACALPSVSFTLHIEVLK